MSKYLVYQPHIHEADAVIAPDIAVESVTAAKANGADPFFQSVPLSRASSSYEIQLTDADWVVRVGYLLVASGNGIILAPALDVLPAEADGQDRIAGGEKSLGRQAWRLPALEGHFSDLTFRLSAFNGTKPVYSKEIPAASMAEPEALVSAYCQGREDLPRAAAVVDIPGTMQPGKLPRGAAIVIRAPDAIALEDDVDRLVLEMVDSRLNRTIDHTVTFARLR